MSCRRIIFGQRTSLFTWSLNEMVKINWSKVGLWIMLILVIILLLDLFLSGGFFE